MVIGRDRLCVYGVIIKGDRFGTYIGSSNGRYMSYIRCTNRRLMSSIGNRTIRRWIRYIGSISG